MTRYLLDTDVLIDGTKGRRAAPELIQRLVAEGHEVGLCSITVAEFYSGIPYGAFPEIDEFLSSLAYWPVSYETSVLAGIDRYGLAKAGWSLTTTDCLIAATSKAVDAVLLTRDRAHWRIPGVAARTPNEVLGTED